MNAPHPAPHGASKAKLALAFAALYTIWGSTYLAIKFAVETIPPYLMSAARFIVAYTWGTLLRNFRARS